MSNNGHTAHLNTELVRLMNAIDILPLHPRNKLLIYQRYVLSKLSWDLTIADLSSTWVKQSLDPIVNRFVRTWLEIPISGTLDIISLSKEKYGIAFNNVSTRYLQCQSTIRNCLKNSKHEDIRLIHETTSTGSNMSIDNYNSTSEVLKTVRSGKESRIKTNLTTQSLVVKAIWELTISWGGISGTRYMTNFLQTYTASVSGT